MSQHSPLPAPVVQDGVVHALGLTYSAVVGFRPLKLDFYRPEGTGPFPLVVQIHGGAFRTGDRAKVPFALEDLFTWLPAQGYAVASISYRLSGEARFPAQVHDVAAAVRWLRAHADELHLDPQRVALWGQSAGAYLAVMTALTARHPSWDGHPDDQPVQAAIDWYGPTDFSLMNAQNAPHGEQDHDAPDSSESQLIGGPIQQHPDAVQRANPCRYVQADAPSILIQHGTHDQLVPFGQAEVLRDALSAAGAHVEFHAIAGSPHSFTGHQNPEVLRNTVLEFLDAHLTP